MTSFSSAAPGHIRGRLLVVLGLGLAGLGVATYAAQISLGRLMLPWYMPVLGLFGAAVVALSLWERRTTGRLLALVAVVLLAGTECASLYALRLPPYTGPIAEGRPFPSFETRRADGTPFTEHDLAGYRSSALVFFRGRW